MNKNILIVGEIFVDVHTSPDTESKITLSELGGIFHSARAFHSLGDQYSIAFFAPDYLDENIHLIGKELGCSNFYKLGTIDGAPGIILINDSKETGDKKYEELLRNEKKYRYSDTLAEIEKEKFTDIIFYPGEFDNDNLIQRINKNGARMHIDIQYNVKDTIFSNHFENVFISSSTPFFKEQCKSDFEFLVSYFSSKSVSNVLLKENRGGSRYYSFHNQQTIDVPRFSVYTKKSVGAGDVFNACFISKSSEYESRDALRFASYIAAIYVSTFCHKAFLQETKMYVNSPGLIFEMKGKRLSWEERKNIKVYVAAPDFPNVDTTLIRYFENALIYHNFLPILPIKQNGLCENNADESKRNSIFLKDIEQLDSCSILVAILLFNDPGTIAEVGYAHGKGKPIILLDPNQICANLFFEKCVDLYCHTVDEALDCVFDCFGRNI